MKRKRRSEKQQPIRDGYVAAITANPNRTGSGYKWSLLIAKRANGNVQQVRQFRLGQDERVSNRILGQRLADLRPYRLIRHIDKSASLRIKQRIASELIVAYGGNLERLFKHAADSDLAVE